MATIPASENVFPEVLLAEVAAPAAAPSGQVRLYVKADGLLYWKDDAGTEYAVGQGDTAGHLADTTDAHDASAISFDPTGLAVIAGTEVQTALEELDAAVDGLGGGGGATIQADLGADVTMVNASTFYDGPSASFAAGTWLVMAQVLVKVIVTTSQTYAWSARIWDGTTIYAEGFEGHRAAANMNNWAFPIQGMFAIVTLGSTTTLKVSVQSLRGSSASQITRDETPLFGLTSHMTTRLLGWKVS